VGFRFRKSIKIAKGVRINLGKTGASVSLGGKGATLNVGTKGVRATIGIPGSGISYSAKISGGMGRNVGHGPTTSPKVAVTGLFGFGTFFWGMAWLLGGGPIAATLCIASLLVAVVATGIKAPSADPVSEAYDSPTIIAEKKIKHVRFNRISRKYHEKECPYDYDDAFVTVSVYEAETMGSPCELCH
jgi:hypothetical protein